MKKRIRAIACATLSLTLLLAGCGAKQEEQQEEPITQQETADREPQIEASAPESEPETEETETQQELTGEDESNTDSSPIFTIENPVIYDAEGVTVTVDEIILGEDRWGEREAELTVSITNNNPDNKKVSFNMYCFANGCVDFGNPFSINELAAGDSFSQPMIISLLSPVDALFKEFGGTANDELPPIAYIDCSYNVQIGSDGDETIASTIIRNTQYNIDDLISMYGDKISEAEAEGLSFEVYAKQNEVGSTLITVANRTENTPVINFDYYGVEKEAAVTISGSLSINGNRLDGDLLRESNTSLASGYENGTFEFYLLAAPEEIRKQLEISNDTPLDAVLTLTFTEVSVDVMINFNPFVLSEVTIPISIE